MIVEIEKLLKYETAGDPINGTKWTRTTTEKVATILRRSLNISISKNTVGMLLKEMNYSLKSNKKIISNGSNIERDKQFEIIRERRKQFEKKEAPIISVDTKKKELIGLFKNSGTTWNLKPISVFDHDFRSLSDGIGIPYGIYDVLENLGFLFVGVSHDTPEFAVNSIAKWWRFYGRKHYPDTNEILILADAGGSNGPNCKAWKRDMQVKICDRYRLVVTVAHYPAGASKWNPIEHRLFSEISKNWAGRPLDSYETMLNYAKTTKTKTGLKVNSYLDLKNYDTGVRVSGEEMNKLAIAQNEVLGKWNYAIRPR